MLHTFSSTVALLLTCGFVIGVFAPAIWMWNRSKALSSHRRMARTVIAGVAGGLGWPGVLAALVFFGIAWALAEETKQKPPALTESPPRGTSADSYRERAEARAAAATAADASAVARYDPNAELPLYKQRQAEERAAAERAWQPARPDAEPVIDPETAIFRTPPKAVEPIVVTGTPPAAVELCEYCGKPVEEGACPCTPLNASDAEPPADPPPVRDALTWRTKTARDDSLEAVAKRAGVKLKK